MSPRRGGVPVAATTRSKTTAASFISLRELGEDLLAAEKPDAHGKVHDMAEGTESNRRSGVGERVVAVDAAASVTRPIPSSVPLARMRMNDLETRVLLIADAVRAGHPDEDSRVELKGEWPDDPQKAARQLGGQANAAGGEPLLWELRAGVAQTLEIPSQGHERWILTALTGT